MKRWRTRSKAGLCLKMRNIWNWECSLASLSDSNMQHTILHAMGNLKILKTLFSSFQSRRIGKVCRERDGG